MNGANVRLADYKGKVILINFWATWCPPCKVEIPGFIELYDRVQGQGARHPRHLGKTIRPRRCATFATEWKINYPMLVGRDEDKLFDAYGPLYGHCRRRSSSGATGRSAAGTWGRRRRRSSSGRSRRSCSMIASTMLKGFTHARLACGCRISFRDGVEGSPVTVVIDQKGPAARSTLHVRDLPLFDYREALRPSTRLAAPQRRRVRRVLRRSFAPLSARSSSLSSLPVRFASFNARPQDELDLAVQAAQVVVCPALNGLEHVAVDPKQERLPVGHGALLIDRARVDDRLRRALAAEHDQQVADHRRLALVVELDDVALATACSSAIWTMPTAPSTIRCRAAMIAPACWRCSIACAISGA